jgi:hypothetical protein
MKETRWWEPVLVLFILFFIFRAFFGKFLTGEYSLATWLDNTHFLLPLFVHISKSFSAGDFPYWINSIAGGIPLYNTPQFSLLYPFYFFQWGLYSTPVDALLHAHYVIFLHVAILWLNTYVMMRIFHLRIVSSVVGATLFAFSANTYQYVYWINIISPYSWLPLAIGSVFLILEDEYPKTGLVLGWTSLYLLVSASPAQALIHFVFCTAFLAASYGYVHRGDKSKWRMPARNLIVLAVGSVLLSSAVLIPVVAFSQRDMVRWTAAGPIVGNQRIPFAGFLSGQAKPSELAKVFFPLNISGPIGDPYLGIIPIFLAVFGLFRRNRNWIVLPLFALALYTLLSSTGAHLGLAYINYKIPFWNKIREPSRHLFLFGLATCTLAAFGFEHLSGSERLRDLRKHALALSSFSLLLLVTYWIRHRYETLVSDSTLLWSFALFVLVLLGCRFTPAFKGALQVVLAVIAIYPAFKYPVPIVKIPDGDYFTEENLRSHRILQEIAKIEPAGNYRLIVRDDHLSPQYWSMNASYYGLRTFEAFMNPLPFGEVQEMFGAPLLPRYAQLLGGKYYLACKDSIAAPSGFSLLREIEGCRLYSTTDVKPHYFPATEIGLSYNKVQEFLDRFSKDDVDLSSLSVRPEDKPEISEWLKDPVPLQWDTSGDRRSGNSLDLDIKTNRRSLLVLNEYFRKEWTASINGKSMKTFKVNLNQIGIMLPAGINHVHFEFRPRLFIWLSYVQLAMFGLLMVGIIVSKLNSMYAPG